MEMDMPMEVDQEPGSLVDLEKFTDYLVDTASKILNDEDNSMIRKALSRKMIKDFAHGLESKVLTIKLMVDDDIVYYEALSDVPETDDKTLAVIFAKKRVGPIANSDFGQQLAVKKIVGCNEYKILCDKFEKIVTPSKESAEHLIMEQEEKPKKISKPKTTKQFEQEERERMARLDEKKKSFNGITYEASSDGMKVLKKLVLDNDEKNPVEVHKSLVRKLKPHQAEGLQFLYDCTIESIDRLDLPGGGGILAHCMGLGKTLQTIAFVHTLLTHPLISKTIRRVLIVVPKNVIINWQNEFSKWISDNDSKMPDFPVYEVDTLKANKDRLARLKTWFTSKKPCVCVIGYDMYRNLTKDYMQPNKKTGKIPGNAPTKKKVVAMQPEFRKYLQSPGPDLVIFDEGHTLKNVDSVISQVVSLIETKRRICLSGTPLSNSLLEYYCMVNFVKGGLLGSLKEFKAQFENPIKKGQSKDSDSYDVSRMKRRCHVLYQKLRGIIDRKDFDILRDSLQPKSEYVINLRLTEKQVKLYQSYLEQYCSNAVDRQSSLFANYHVFSRISTHPYQVVVHQEEKDAKDGYESEEVSDDEFGAQGNANQQPKDWFKKGDILEEDDRNDYSQSYKLLFLLEIIKKCEAVGDKLLVFSQSLESLRLIERMLRELSSTWFNDGHEAVLKKDGQNWGWKFDKDFMLINGSVSSKRRDDIQKQFNRSDNPRSRVCLISTKAGSLGTNFVGANRVVIFDQNWNPAHDRQALFRAYRFGQVKPVFIYRLVAHGTIEDRVYARQVIKESVAGRVIDEHQIGRHYLNSDLEALYTLTVDDYDSSKPPLYTVPEDTLLANVFMRLKEGIVNCLQHDSLLAHQEDEVLTPEEMALAWTEFQSKKLDAPARKVTKNIAPATEGGPVQKAPGDPLSTDIITVE